MSSPNLPKPITCFYNENASIAPPSVLSKPPELEYAVAGCPDPALAYVIGPEDPADVNEIVLALHGWRSSAAKLAWFGTELSNRNPNRAVVIPEQPRSIRPSDRRSLPLYIKHEGSTQVIGQRRTRAAAAAGAAACQRFPNAGNTIDVVGHSLGVVDAVNIAVESTDFTVKSLSAYAGAGLFSKDIVQGVKRRLTREALHKLQEEPLQVMTEARYAFQQDISYKLIELIERQVSLYSVEFEKDDLFQPNSRRSLFFPDGHTLVKADATMQSCACHCAPIHPHEATRMSELYDDLHAGKYAGHSALAAHRKCVPAQAVYTPKYGLQTA